MRRGGIIRSVQGKGKKKKELKCSLINKAAQEVRALSLIPKQNERGPNNRGGFKAPLLNLAGELRASEMELRAKK